MQIPSRKTEEKDLYSTTKRGEGERQFQQFNKVWQDEASCFAAKIIKQGSDADPLIHDPLSGQRSLVLNAWIEASLGNVFLTKTSRHSSFVIAALRNLHQGHHHQNDHEDWRSWWWGCRASENAGSNWEVLVESNWQLLYSYKGYLGGGYGVLLRRRWWRPLAPRTFGQTRFHPIIGI